MLKQVGITSCILASVAFTGCATTTNPSTEKNLNKLQNTHWVLSEIKGVELKAEDPTSLPSIEFTNDRVSGSDGCNRFMGGYAVQAKEIKLSQMASTARACLNATEIPQNFNLALQSVTQYDADTKELKFLDANNNTLLKFKAIDQK